VNPPHSQDPPETRSIRCLQIVIHTYDRGSVSLRELAELTGTDSATLQHDIAALQGGGLRIRIEDPDRCRVDQAIPGFALRLTSAEAVAAWIKCRHCSRCLLLAGTTLPPEVLAAACSILAGGLRIHHPDSEEAFRRSADHPAHGGVPILEKTNWDDRSNLTGRTRRVVRCLWMFDWIESGRAVRRDQLTALLGVSERTVGNDLRMMRRAGLPIAFQRGERSYRVDGMHAYFKRVLSAPDGPALAAALSMLFDVRGEAIDRDSVGPSEAGASRTILRSLGLIFKDRQPELEAGIARFGGCVRGVDEKA